eukprot:m.83256 g.83256  ORF g.83256 m.83256 type:complete len:515 (+) comp12718_c0_seq2:156-1700(+)
MQPSSSQHDNGNEGNAPGQQTQAWVPTTGMVSPWVLADMPPGQQPQQVAPQPFQQHTIQQQASLQPERSILRPVQPQPQVVFQPQSAPQPAGTLFLATPSNHQPSQQPYTLTVLQGPPPIVSTHQQYVPFAQPVPQHPQPQPLQGHTLVFSTDPVGQLQQPLRMPMYSSALPLHIQPQQMVVVYAPRYQQPVQQQPSQVQVPSGSQPAPHTPSSCSSSTHPHVHHPDHTRPVPPGDSAGAMGSATPGAMGDNASSRSGSHSMHMSARSKAGLGLRSTAFHPSAWTPVASSSLSGARQTGVPAGRETGKAGEGQLLPDSMALYVVESNLRTRQVLPDVSEHMKVIEPEGGPRTFLCSICSKKSDNGSNMRKHIRTHFGTRVHDCRLCGIRYTNTHNRNRHEMLHLVKPKRYHIDPTLATEAVLAGLRRFHASRIEKWQETRRLRRRRGATAARTNAGKKATAAHKQKHKSQEVQGNGEKEGSEDEEDGGTDSDDVISQEEDKEDEDDDGELPPSR